MTVAVVGASGKTGLHLIRLLSAKGTPTMALARSSQQLQGLKSITAVQVDVMNPKTLNDEALPSDLTDVFIVLGSKELRGNTIRSMGTQNVLSALKQLKLNPRIHLMSAAGVGNSWQQLDWFSKLLSKLLLPAVMREHEKQEQLVTMSGFEYIIYRPTGLSDKGKAERYQRVSSGALPSTSIERLSVAQCMVEGMSQEAWRNSAFVVTAGK